MRYGLGNSSSDGEGGRGGEGGLVARDEVLVLQCLCQLVNT